MFGLKQPPKIAPDVRFATARDIQQMLEIELLSFDRPWNRLDFMVVMRQKDVMAVTAELCDTVVAYAVVEKRARHTKIWNLAVAPHLRRRGLGRTVVEKLKASVGRLSPLRALICERNLPAQLFFKAVGFRAVGISHDEFVDGQDGYRFVWKETMQIEKCKLKNAK